MIITDFRIGMAQIFIFQTHLKFHFVARKLKIVYIKLKKQYIGMCSWICIAGDETIGLGLNKIWHALLW